MPFNKHKKDIIWFSELYQFSTTFHTTPDKILNWKKTDPYLFDCFRAFFSGMSKENKNENGTSNNRHNSGFKKATR